MRVMGSISSGAAGRMQNGSLTLPPKRQRPG
jgi:hypothetical protein